MVKKARKSVTKKRKLVERPAYNKTGEKVLSKFGSYARAQATARSELVEREDGIYWRKTGKRFGHPGKKHTQTKKIKMRLADGQVVERHYVLESDSSKYRRGSWNNIQLDEHQLSFLRKHGFIPVSVDHIDGVSSHSSNLQASTPVLNNLNSRAIGRASKYRGVSRARTIAKYRKQEGWLAAASATCDTEADAAKLADKLRLAVAEYCIERDRDKLEHYPGHKLKPENFIELNRA